MNRIKQLRKEKKIKQTELAKILNLSQASVSLWETNKTTPNEEEKIKLSKYFNCTPDYLMGYTDINLKEKNTDKNKITLIGRNGLIEEYTLTDEEMAAYRTLFKNRDKYQKDNEGNF